jgi:chloramphenicol-sensitive protein RarD
MNPGTVYAALAFVMWGLFPLYFHMLPNVAAFELVLQRLLWSLLFLALVLAVMKRWAWLASLRQQPKQMLVFVSTALLLSVNSLVYVYAVQSNQVVQASLGYFINPLFNVLLGVLVLRERLGAVKWLAVGLATAGVVWLTWHVGELPWIALALAASFALYGLLRKTATLGALEGLALETALLAPLALPLLVWWTFFQGGALARGDLSLTALLAFSGPMSVLPLLLFAAGARRLPLASLGLLQYISPSMQLLLGVWLFNEPFDSARLLGFVLIWAALALVSADALRQMFKPAVQPPP